MKIKIVLFIFYPLNCGHDAICSVFFNILFNLLFYIDDLCGLVTLTYRGCLPTNMKRSL